MNQLLVRNLDESLVRKLKKLASENGISTEEQHRRLLTEALSNAGLVKEPLADYLVNHPVLPELEIPLYRSRDVEERDTGI